MGGNHIKIELTDIQKRKCKEVSDELIERHITLSEKLKNIDVSKISDMKLVDNKLISSEIRDIHKELGEYWRDLKKFKLMFTKTNYYTENSELNMWDF